MAVVAQELMVKFGADVSEVDKAEKHVSGLGDRLGNVLSTGVGFALGTVINKVIGDFGSMVGAGLEFGKQMSNVNSILKLSDAGISALGDQVLALTRNPGITDMPANLAAGLYDISSSGFTGADGLMVLENAARAAAAGVTTTAVAAQGGTAILNAYGLSASDSAKVFDQMFQVVNDGVITFDQLAANLGNVLPVAASLGIGFDQVGAAFAQMTLQGVGASQAETQIAALMKAALAPTDALTAAVTAQGYASAESLISTEGLAGFLKVLSVASGGSKEEMLNLVGTQEAMNAAMLLGGDNLDAYIDELIRMQGASEGAGATQEALDKQMRSASFQLAKAKQQAYVLATTLTKWLEPSIAGLASSAAEGIGRFTNWLTGAFALTFDFEKRLGKSNIEAFFSTLGITLENITGLNLSDWFDRMGKAMQRPIDGAKKMFTALGKKNWKMLAAGIGDTISSLPKFVGDALKGIETGFEPLDRILHTAGKLFTDFGRLIQELGQGDIDGFLKVLDRMGDHFVDLGEQLWDGLWGAISSIDWGAVWDTIYNDVIGGIIGADWGGLGDLVSNTIKEKIGLPEQISWREFAASLFQTLRSDIEDYIGDLDFRTMATSVWNRVWTAISTVFSIAFPVVLKFAASAAEWVWGEFSTGAAWLYDKAKSGVSWVMDTGIPATLKFAADAAEWSWGGFATGAAWLYDKAKSGVNWVFDTGIPVSLKFLAQWGGMIWGAAGDLASWVKANIFSGGASQSSADPSYAGAAGYHTAGPAITIGEIALQTIAAWGGIVWGSLGDFGSWFKANAPKLADQTMDVVVKLSANFTSDGSVWLNAYTALKGWVLAQPYTLSPSIQLDIEAASYDITTALIDAVTFDNLKWGIAIVAMMTAGLVAAPFVVPALFIWKFGVAIYQGITSAFTGIRQAVIDAMSGFWNDIFGESDIFGSNGSADPARGFVEGGNVGMGQQIIDAVGSFISEAATGITNKAAEWWESIKTAIDGIIPDSITDPKLPDFNFDLTSVETAITDAYNYLVGIVPDWMKKLADGDVMGAIRSLFGSSESTGSQPVDIKGEIQQDQVTRHNVWGSGDMYTGGYVEHGEMQQFVTIPVTADTTEFDSKISDAIDNFVTPSDEFKAVFTADMTAVDKASQVAWLLGGAWADSIHDATFTADYTAVDQASIVAWTLGNSWDGTVFTASFSVDTSGLTNAVEVARQAAQDIADLMPHSPARKGPLKEPISFDFIADNMKGTADRLGEYAHLAASRVGGAFGDRYGLNVGMGGAGNGSTTVINHNYDQRQFIVTPDSEQFVEIARKARVGGDFAVEYATLKQQS